MFACLLVLIFVRPFISSLAFPFINTLFSISLLLFLAAWVIYRGVPSEKICPVRYPLIFFSLALITSVIISPNQLNSLKEFYKYLSGISLFLIAASLSQNEKSRAIRTIVFAAFIISILAIYQYLFGFKNLLAYLTKNAISDPFALDYINQKRVFFPFVTPNILAGYIIFVMPLALMISGKKKWLILTLFFITLALSKSVGAFLSLFLGAWIYLYLRFDLPKKKYLILAAIALLPAFIFIIRQAGNKEHVLPAFSITQRLAYWKHSLEIIKAHPLLGVGLGNFNLPLSRYAHNSYLQIWAETGIFAAACLLWFIISTFRAAITNIMTGPYKKESCLITFAFCVFLAHNLVDFSFFLPESALLWWFICGLLI